MRKMMWFALGFGASCAVGAYLISGDPLLGLGLCAVLLSAGVYIAGKRFRAAVAASVVLLGCSAGALWNGAYDALYLKAARELDGFAIQSTMELTDYSWDSSFGIAADAKITMDGKPYQVRVYLEREEALLPGTVIEGSFRFRVTTDGGAEEQTFHQGKGIFLMAYDAGDIKVMQPDGVSMQYGAVWLRHELLALIDRIFPEDTASFARALLLGDGTRIDYETNTAFKISGIRHIIAVSGLHVSILFSLIYLFSGKHRVLTALIGIPVLLIFAAVAGFTPSVTRACIMNGLMMLALLFEREYDPPTALSFAVLAMLVVNPLVITSVSFQLSVGCMAGIFLFAEPIRTWLLDEKHLGHAKGKDLKSRFIRWFAGSVSVSLGAASITTPLSAVYFGAVSLVSVFTNLLTLWVVTVVFYGIMAACAVGAVWSAGGQILAWLLSWPIRYILTVARGLSALPMAAVYTRSDFIVVWLVGVYILFVLFLLLRGSQPLLFGSLAVISLCAALLASWITPSQDHFRMTVLDVGQGQSIILQSEGRTFVVDCGGSYSEDAADAAAETLLSMGISRIDGLILTHYDADHAGGAGYLLSRIQADVLYLPPWEADNETAEALGEQENAEIYPVTEDLQITYGETTMYIAASTMEDSGNESSLCVLFQAADCDILITGDRGSLGERLLMRALDLPKLDVLVAGHHGSQYSTCDELLALTTPRVAVISVGADNAYGHPAQELLERLEYYGCRIFRTDEDGTIIIRR